MFLVFEQIKLYHQPVLLQLPRADFQLLLLLMERLLSGHDGAELAIDR